jgi:hypothetical protein
MIGLAYAALPLVVVGGVADFVGGLVFSTAARQAVITVGVAANDASWLAPVMSLAARAVTMLRIASAVDGAVTTYDIPMLPDTELTPGGVTGEPVKEGAQGSFTNPIPYTGFRVHYNSTMGGCEVRGSRSTDGVTHTVKGGYYDSVSALAAACAEVLAYDSHFTGQIYIFSPFGEPTEVAMNGNYYYIDTVYVMFGCSGGNGYCDVSEQGSFFLNQYFRSGINISYAITNFPDGIKTFARSDSGFFPLPSDPDWTPEEIEHYSGNPSPLKFVDANGNIVTLSGTSEGTVIQSSTQIGPDVKLRTAELTKEAVAKSVREEVVKNATAAEVAAASVAAGTGANTGTQTGTGTGSIQFPSDYARQGEAGAAAETILGKSEEFFTDSNVSEFEQADKNAEFKEAFFLDDFTDMLEWQLPSHSSECPVAEIDVKYFSSDSALIFDSHCEILENPDVKGVADVSFLVMWILSALFVVLKA